LSDECQEQIKTKVVPDSKSKVFSFGGRKFLKRYEKLGGKMEITPETSDEEFYRMLKKYKYESRESTYSERPAIVLYRHLEVSDEKEEKLKNLGLTFYNLISAYTYKCSVEMGGKRPNFMYENMAIKTFDIDNFVLGNNYSRILVGLDSDSKDLLELAKLHRDNFISQLKEGV